MIFGDALKLKLSPETAGRLVDKGKLAGVPVELEAKTSYTDAYFDTPRYSYYKSGTVFALRTEGWAATQTISQLGPGGMETLSSAQLSSQSQMLDLGEGWRGHLGLKPNAPPPTRRIFSSDLEEYRFILRTESCKIRLTLVTGEIRVSGPVFKYVAETVCDAALELISGSEQGLLDYALKLVETQGAQLQTDTIAERGFALTSTALQKSHAKAVKVQLDPSHTVGTGLRAILRSTITHLLSNQTAALRHDVNGVHQTRVAIRRLRAALRAFKAVLPYEGRKAFNGELRWFQQRTGPARDWHVFIDETLPRLKAKYVDPEEMPVLRKLAVQEGRMHAQEAAELLQSRRYARLLLRFGRWVAELFEDDRARHLRKPITPFARKTLAKTHRDLLKELKAARPGHMEDMHKVRIRGKKARYAGEFFAALFESDESRQYLNIVENLQERLGGANDARVARALVTELKHGILLPQTITGVQAWSSRRVARCLDQARPTLRALQTAAPFWKEP